MLRVWNHLHLIALRLILINLIVQPPSQISQWRVLIWLYLQYLICWIEWCIMVAILDLGCISKDHLKVMIASSKKIYNANAHTWSTQILHIKVRVSRFGWEKFVEHLLRICGRIERWVCREIRCKFGVNWGKIYSLLIFFYYIP